MPMKDLLILLGGGGGGGGLSGGPSIAMVFDSILGTALGIYLLIIFR